MAASNTKVAIYDSARRSFRALDELRVAFEYRNLIFQLVRRNVLARYKRSVLGVAWTMINPLGTMLILTIVFSQVFKIEGYAAYVLSGILVWSFFSQTTVACMVDLTWGGQLLHRIFMPRTAFALAAVGTGLVNLVLSIIPLIAILLVSGIDLNASALFLPVAVIVLACFSLGFGLFISTFAVFFPDFSEMYQVGLTAWMYLTPIIYPMSALDPNLQFWVKTLNPLYGLVNLFRLPLYDGRMPTWAEFWPSALISIVMLVIGWIFFARRSDELSYRI